MTTTVADIEPSITAMPDGVVLHADQTFDVPAALKLREAIARLPPASAVTLDFSRTRDCHDFALAALVHAVSIMGRVGQVNTRGLREHHHRLLKYLGPSVLS